jgi:EcsC protein family
VTKIVSQVYARLGMRLTQRELGQAVPVIGAVVGAGLNARMLSCVVDDAQRVYRRRFLRERYDLPDPPETPVAISNEAGVIPVADLVDAELVADVDDPR